MTGRVEVAGRHYPLIDLAPGGGALDGVDCWWEDDVMARITVSCGTNEFVLARVLRCCYLDPVRHVTGFEFLGITPDHTDMVLGLMLASQSGADSPLAVSRANARALKSLARHGHARCPEGGWSAEGSGDMRIWDGDEDEGLGQRCEEYMQ